MRVRKEATVGEVMEEARDAAGLGRDEELVPVNPGSRFAVVEVTQKVGGRGWRAGGRPGWRVVLRPLGQRVLVLALALRPGQGELCGGL